MKIFISIILIFALYAIILEPNFLEIKHLTFKSEEIPPLRIVFVSDFHLSKFANKRFQKIIDAVNNENPDIIISGGDYFILHDAKLSMNADKIADGISKMKSKYGTYSVLGNHDYFSDEKIIKDALIKKGIHILENSNEKITIGDKTLYISGISDMQTTHYNLKKALDGVVKPVILVSHSPDITPQAKDKVNLILSGHTHGGQVRIPLYGAVIVPSKYGKRYESGFLENIVYVSKGLGTSMLRMRFNCIPEITVIDYE